MTAKTKNIIDADGIMHLLDLCYQKAVNGVEFVSPPIEVMADNYLQKYSTPSIAAKKNDFQSDFKVYYFRIHHRFWWCYNTSCNCPCQYKQCDLCTNADDCLYSIYGRI